MFIRKFIFTGSKMPLPCSLFCIVNKVKKHYDSQTDRQYVHVSVKTRKSISVSRILTKSILADITNAT